MQRSIMADKRADGLRASVSGLIAAAAIAMMAGVPPAFAAETSASDDRIFPDVTWTITVENDRIVRIDRHYTHGTRIAWVSDRTTGGPDAVRDTLDFLYPLAEVRSGRIGVAVGQNLYTPQDTGSRSLVVDDRPYAGWLYGAVSIYAENDWKTSGGFEFTTLDSVELNLGVVGPMALGEQTQNNFHDLIGVGRSNGWHNQLENELAAVLFFERKWRPGAMPITTGLEADVIPQFGGSVGNVFTLLNAGFTARIGSNLGTDFGPPQNRPAFSGPGSVQPDTDFVWYLFAGAQGSAVGRNIFSTATPSPTAMMSRRKRLSATFRLARPWWLTASGWQRPTSIERGSSKDKARPIASVSSVCHSTSEPAIRTGPRSVRVHSAGTRY